MFEYFRDLLNKLYEINETLKSIDNHLENIDYYTMEVYVQNKNR